MLYSESSTPDIFVIYDEAGRAIGRIVQPKHEPLVGQGQETVLLVRAS